MVVKEDEILVDNKVYSAEKLAELHPGGPLFALAFAGRDATQAFLSYHRRSFPHSGKVAKHAYKKEADKEDVIDPEVNRDFLDLCERVDKVRSQFLDL